MNEHLNPEHIESSYTVYLGSYKDNVSLKIRSFGSLIRGWDFGIGDPIEPEIIERALEIHKIGSELNLSSDAIPEVDGGITLTFVHKEDAVQIIINPSGTYTGTYQRGIGPEFEELFYEEDVDWATAIQYLQELKKEAPHITCKSYERLEQIDMTRGLNVFWKIPYSKIAVEVYQPLIMNVFSTPEMCAPIWKTGT